MARTSRSPASLVSPYGLIGTQGVSSVTRLTSGMPYTAAEDENTKEGTAAAVTACRSPQALDVLAVVVQRQVHGLADLLLRRQMDDARDPVALMVRASRSPSRVEPTTSGTPSGTRSAIPVDRSS